MVLGVDLQAPGHTCKPLITAAVVPIRSTFFRLPVAAQERVLAGPAQMAVQAMDLELGHAAEAPVVILTERSWVRLLAAAVQEDLALVGTGEMARCF